MKAVDESSFVDLNYGIFNNSIECDQYVSTNN